MPHKIKCHVVEITEVTESTDVELTEVLGVEQTGRCQERHNPLPARVKEENARSTKKDSSTFLRQASSKSLAEVFSQFSISSLLWSLVVLSTCLGCLYALFYHTQEFRKQRPITYIDDATAPLTEIRFPSITICNVNQVRLSLLEKAGLGSNLTAGDVKYLINYFLLGKNIVGRQPDNWEAKLSEIQRKLKWDPEHQPFANVSAQECNRMILNANWRQKHHYDVLTQKSFTDYGVCCRIFPWLDFENNSTNKKPASEYTNEEHFSTPLGAKNGVKNGLELLLDMEAFEYAYFPRSAKGFTLAVSNPFERPVLRHEGFYVEPGACTLVSMQVQGTFTTPAALAWFQPPASRNCYQDTLPDPDLVKAKLARYTDLLEESEFQPLHFNRLQSNAFEYTMSNCLYASMIEKIIKNCSCQPIFGDSDGIMDDRKKVPHCVGTELACLENWMLKWGEGEHGLDSVRDMKSGNTQKCLRACSGQTIRLETSSSAFPSALTLPDRHDFYIIVRKINKTCQDSYRRNVFQQKYGATFCANVSVWLQEESLKVSPASNPHLELGVLKYARDNLALVKIFLRDPYFVKIAQDVGTTPLTYLGNVGGLIGILTGLSVISLMEKGIMLIVSLVKKKEQ